MWQTSLGAVVETALNTYLKLDYNWQQNLSEMAGASLAIELIDWEVTLYFLFHTAHIDVLTQYEDRPDATIKGKSFELFKLSQDETQAGVHQGEVTISGKLDLAQKFKTLMDNTYIDWESHLEKYVGEMAAYQTGRVVRGAMEWGQETRQTLMLNISEYLQEEAHQLPPKAEVEGFFSDVVELRSDVSRTEARLRRLERMLAADSE